MLCSPKRGLFTESEKRFDGRQRMVGLQGWWDPGRPEGHLWRFQHEKA